MAMKPIKIGEDVNFRDVRRIIEESRASVAAAVNTGLTMLYLRIGRRVRQETLQAGRANCLYTVETIEGRVRAGGLCAI